MCFLFLTVWTNFVEISSLYCSNILVTFKFLFPLSLFLWWHSPSLSVKCIISQVRWSFAVKIYPYSDYCVGDLRILFLIVLSFLFICLSIIITARNRRESLNIFLSVFIVISTSIKLVGLIVWTGSTLCVLWTCVDVLRVRKFTFL